MPMDLKPPGAPPALPASLTRFQLGVAGGLVVALLVLLAQRGFLTM
jgi:purine-cytosine permease-like protein